MNDGTKLDLQSLVKFENEMSTLRLPSRALTRDTSIRSKSCVVGEEMLPPSLSPDDGSIVYEKYKEDTFYRAIGPLITIIQFFGLLPMTGILGKNPTCLRFKLFSWRMLYSMLILSALGVMSFATLYNFFETGVIFSKFGGVVFYVSAFITHITFLRLAPRWPRLSITITKGEVKSTRQQRVGRSLYFRFGIHTFLILFFALVEHLMSIASGFSVVYMCDRHLPNDYKFYKSSFSHIFSYTDYAIWKAIIAQITNLVATIHWNLKDLFIILISIELAQRFEQLNDSLTEVLGKHLPEQFWRVARSEYAHLAGLVAEVDNAINEIIMVSFANNLYSICIQIFNSFNLSHEENITDLSCWKLADGGLSTSVYYVFSFGFMIFRFLAVALYASRIYSASRGPLEAIYSVPPDSYCTEVRRFLEHVTTDTVALSGLNIFYITKGLILTITGTVLTYVLVLVQFNSPTPSVTANIILNDTCRSVPCLTA